MRIISLLSFPAYHMYLTGKYRHFFYNRRNYLHACTPELGLGTNHIANVNECVCTVRCLFDCLICSSISIEANPNRNAHTRGPKEFIKQLCGYQFQFGLFVCVYFVFFFVSLSSPQFCIHAAAKRQKRQKYKMH